MINHHFVLRHCAKHSHVGPPASDGHTEITYTDPDRNVRYIPFEQMTPELQENVLYFHSTTSEDHLAIPLHTISEFKIVEESPEYTEAFKLWYRVNHGVTLQEVVLAARKEKEIKEAADFRSLMQELGDLGLGGF